ncbi:MAG: hypothetical protein AAB439_00390 [Patescibacteria group bacterium]
MRHFFFTLSLFALLSTPLSPVVAFGGGILGCGAAQVGGAVTGAVQDAVATGAASALGFSVSGAIPVDVRGSVKQDISTLKTKECVMDGLAIALAEGMIGALTQNIVDWINSGFEGSPAFVTDFRGFLGDIADQTALDFLEGTELEFICSPFQLEVRLALAVQRQPFQERIRCSLGDVTDNIEGFLGGDFSQGGWPAWFRLYTEIQNIPYGSYLLSEAQLHTEIDSRQDAGRWEVTVGGGLFSKKRCKAGAERVAKTYVEGYESEAVSEPRCLEYEIVTPGTVFNEQLNNALGTGQRKLELADEFDEVINALLAQLAQQALTSIDGLRGLSSRSSSSAGTIRNANGEEIPASYLETLVNESTDNSINLAQDALLTDIEVAIESEEDYQNVTEDLIDGLEEIADDYGKVYACYMDIVQNPASFSTISGTTALGLANAASTTAATSIKPRLQGFQNNINLSFETVEALVKLLSTARAAKTVDQLNLVADEYDALLASGIIHTANDVAVAELDLFAQSTTLAELEDTLSDQTLACRRTN